MNPKNNYYVEYLYKGKIFDITMFNTITEINEYVVNRVKGEILVIKKNMDF